MASTEQVAERPPSLCPHEAVVTKKQKSALQEALEDIVGDARQSACQSIDPDVTRLADAIESLAGITMALLARVTDQQ